MTAERAYPETLATKTPPDLNRRLGDLRAAAAKDLLRAWERSADFYAQLRDELRRLLGETVPMQARQSSKVKGGAESVTPFRVGEWPLRPVTASELEDLRSLGDEGRTLSAQPAGLPAELTLRDPMLLAALAIPAAIVVLVGIMVLGGSKSATFIPADVAEARDVLVVPVGPVVTSGAPVVAKSVAVTTLREGPGLDTPAIASLPIGHDVEVIGRDTGAAWVKVRFPLGSTTDAWVPASAIKMTEAAIRGLPLVTRGN